MIQQKKMIPQKKMKIGKKEIFAIILGYLDKKDIIEYNMVCQMWYN